jgi:signal transduction histidine kinase
VAGPRGYARRMGAPTRPPLVKRVPPGGWMAISWAAVMAYAFSGWLTALRPGGSAWHRVMLGLHIIASDLGWPGLALCGVLVLSAALVRRWPLLALGLLLAAAIGAARVPQPAESDASFLTAPAGFAVGFISATARRRVSVPAAVIAFGVLASYGTNWRGDGLTADSWPVAVAIAWLIGQSIRQHRLHAATLRTQAEAAAVTAERLRIAGDLHDMVAHSIGVIAIQAGAGSRVIGTQPAEARDALSAIEATSRETLAGVRRTLGALRRSEPGEKPGHPPAGPAPPIGAMPRPPLAGRALPGAWMVASWCAVIAYVVSAQMLAPGGFLLLAPGTRHAVPTGISGLRVILDGLAAMPWPLVATAGVVVLSAVLLRRWPLPTLALLLAGGIGASVMPEPWLIGDVPIPPALIAPAFFLIPPTGVAVGCIAAVRSRPVSIGAAVIAAGVLARCAGGFTWAPWGFPNGASAALAAAVTMVIAWLVGQSIRQNRMHADTLRAQAEATAVTAERLRIARELHDMVAHSIGVIAIQAGAGSRVIDTQPAEARNALGAIEATSREALAGLRHTLGASCGAAPGPNPALAPLDPAPGLADIGQLAATAMSAGVRIDVRWQGQRRPLPADVDESAFRIIREAVTNVVRHAGTGDCQVIIDQHDDEVAIEVLDDGRGGSANGTGYGITGMQERARLLHGQLTAGPRPQGGFRVAARLPLPVAAGV